jgi:hypothetical protein
MSELCPRGLTHPLGVDQSNTICFVLEMFSPMYPNVPCYRKQYPHTDHSHLYYDVSGTPSTFEHGFTGRVEISI